MNTLGLQIFFNNDPSKPNIVFDEDEQESHTYFAGMILMEMLNDEAIEILTSKVKRMIKLYPKAQEIIDSENIADCLSWLFVATYDDYPAASALFRRIMYDTASLAINEYDSFDGVTVQDFYNSCYDKYISELEKFYYCLDAIIANVGNNADDNQMHCLEQLESYATDVYDEYTKCCRIRHGDNGIERDTIPINTWQELLLFEYCRLKKENKAIKICQHCGKIFIPANRTSITIYCNSPSPEDPQKTCREVGPYYKRVEKRKVNPELQEYDKTISKLYMRIQRARSYNLSEEDIEKIYNKLKKVKDEHKNIMLNTKEKNNEEVY